MSRKIKYSLIFGILGIVFLVFSIASLVPYVKYQMGPADFNELAANEFKNGLVVEGDLYFSYDCFAEEYQTRNGIKQSTTAQYYLAPMGEQEFIAISVPSPMFDDMDKLCDSSYAYMSYATDNYPEPVHIIGELEKTDKEIQGYMIDWFEEMGWTEEIENISDYVIPYTISIINIDGLLTGGIVFGILGLVLLLVGVLMLVSFIKLRKSSVNSVQTSSYPNTDMNQHDYIPDNGTNQNSTVSVPEHYDNNQKPPCEL